MRLTTLTISLLLATSCLSISAHNSTDRKKKATTTVQTETDGEKPDALPQMAHKERTYVVINPEFSKKGGTGYCNTKYLEGIDVSHHNSTIDWATVGAEANVSYVYIKGTEGRDFVDSQYERNIEGAHQAGISVGAYHFYRPLVSVEDNFQNMISIIHPEDQDLAPMIDIEVDQGVSVERLRDDMEKFIKKVEKYYGRKPLIYTGQHFYNKHFQNFMPGYDWMIARYSETPPVLEDGYMCYMWQYSDNGKIPGIKGHCDRSCLMNGNVLKKMQM